MRKHRAVKVAGIVFALGFAWGGCQAEGEEFDVMRGAQGKYKKKPKHCTRTQGYWRNHNVYAEQPNNQIPWPISEDTIGCGDTWYNWLWVEPQGDAWVIVAHQWVAAQLNWGSGAPVTPEVEQAIYDGGAFLSACSVSEEDRAAALEVAALLDAYNNGEAGVASCDSLE
jgi:hypothetical protein